MRERSDEVVRTPLEIETVPANAEPDVGARGQLLGSERPSPRFRDLDEHECLSMLARHRVGRLAYSFRDRVSIEPVHYVFDAGWLYGRTSPGKKLDVIRKSRWVAFAVDEIDDVFEWRSVVAHGGFYTLDPEHGAPDEIEAHSRAIELLRRIVPETGTPADPVPYRNVVFRIHVDRLEGRQATTKLDTEREVPLEP